MKFADYEIQPLLMYLPDEQKWVDEWERAKVYLKDQGFTDIINVAGVHGEKFGITNSRPYLLDGRPEEKFMVGPGKVGNYMTYYILYSIMSVMDRPYYMILEGDVKFKDGWKESLNKALTDCPDFDIMFVGSCCTQGKEMVRIGDTDVYNFPYRGEAKWDYYPMCGHCWIVNKRCIQILLDTQRDATNPSDVSLIKYAFPKLKIVAVLPRLADQGTKTNLPI